MSASPKPFAKLKVALVSDELTRSCLQQECRVWNITPRNYHLAFRLWRPDFLLVESAWSGWKNSWKYRIASYEDHPERTNEKLLKTVTAARNAGIPCVFWNKEDAVHFERFIRSATLFDIIFTVDINCVPQYRARIARSIFVEPLMFGVQPAIHHPSGPGYTRREACFLGSYSRHLHERRRQHQEMLFSAACEIGLTIFDRNSDRTSENYRFPIQPGMRVRPQVSHENTAKVYRDFMVSLNINTVEDSETMFSRRLIEIMACGGLAVTTPAKSVERHFRELCHVVAEEEEARQLFRQWKRGLSPADKEMKKAAAENILLHHTWAHRLETILHAIRR